MMRVAAAEIYVTLPREVLTVYKLHREPRVPGTTSKGAMFGLHNKLHWRVAYQFLFYRQVGISIYLKFDDTRLTDQVRRQ